LPELAAAFAAAYRSLRADYRDDAHLLSIFAPGRGNYAYISREREWQQTAGFLGKLTAAQARFFAAPFTSGPRPGFADYLPAPQGLPGFAAPVEHAAPALATFLELEGGGTVV